MTRNFWHRLAIASSVVAALLVLGMMRSDYHPAPPDCPTVEAAPVEAIPLVEPCPASAAITADENDEGKARKAATEWVKNKLPGSKVEGVFTLTFGKGNLYLAGVDTQIGEKQRRTIDLLVRRYTRRGGSQYFRAETIGQEQAAQMLQGAKAAPSD